MWIICFTVFRFHKYSIHFLYYTFIEFIILLYTFLVISFGRYKKYLSCLISFKKFLDVLPAFTCASAIGNLSSICLGVSILILEWLGTLPEKRLPSIFVENILLSKALRTLFLHSRRLYKFLKTSSFCCFFSGLFCFAFLLKFKISTNKSLWSSFSFFCSAFSVINISNKGAYC